MSCRSDELLERIEEAAAKARAQNGGKPARRMEMSRESFEVFIDELGKWGLEEFEVEYGGNRSVIAPNDELAENQFVFEFD